MGPKKNKLVGVLNGKYHYSGQKEKVCGKSFYASLFHSLLLEHHLLTLGKALLRSILHEKTSLKLDKKLIPLKNF